MKFTLDDLLFTLETAAQVSETYDLYVLQGRNRPRTTDDLIWVCSEHLGKRLTLVELEIDASARNVEAVCIANRDGSFEIGILAGLTKDEQRFVVCKEIFHVLLDRDECHNLNLYDHVASTLTAQDEHDRIPTKAAASEELAIIGALEYIFPYAAREALAAATEGRMDADDLAEQYGIPRRFIDLIFSEHAMAFFRQVMPMLERPSDSTQ